MCISPRLRLNPKYLSNSKNGGNPPPLIDERVKYVPIGCGVCYECLKQKSNQWKVRLYEEVKGETDWSFVTFTFSPESLESLIENPAPTKRTTSSFRINSKSLSYLFISPPPLSLSLLPSTHTTRKPLGRFRIRERWCRQMHLVF